MKKLIAAAVLLVLLLLLLPLAVIRTPPLGQIGSALPAAPAAEGDGSGSVYFSSEGTDAAQTVQVLDGGQVVTMAMNEYLWGVTAAEMPASFEEEALKAQAAAARTYLIYKMAHPSGAHPQADICTDHTCCAAYITPEQALENWGSKGAEYGDKLSRAVAETDGQIITYGGQAIQAVFFSSAAGVTRDAAEVWSASVPYLQPVATPEGAEVPNYRSTASVTLEEFRAALSAAYPQADLSGPPETWIGPETLSAGGSVTAVAIGGVQVPTAALRRLFSLRSASLSLSAGAEGVTFTVTGYGHGVGMSQYGANALAKEGRTWKEILEWYYSGVTVAPLDAPTAEG